MSTEQDLTDFRAFTLMRGLEDTLRVIDANKDPEDFVSIIALACGTFFLIGATLGGIAIGIYYLAQCGIPGIIMSVTLSLGIILPSWSWWRASRPHPDSTLVKYEEIRKQLKNT